MSARQRSITRAFKEQERIQEQVQTSEHSVVSKAKPVTELRRSTWVGLVMVVVVCWLRPTCDTDNRGSLLRDTRAAPLIVR